MDELLKFAGRNGWAAFGIGVTVALWLLGGVENVIDDDVYRILPDFADTDDEIGFHERRLDHLRQIKAADDPIENLLDELRDVVEIIRRDVSELKARE